MGEREEPHTHAARSIACDIVCIESADNTQHYLSSQLIAEHTLLRSRVSFHPLHSSPLFCPAATSCISQQTCKPIITISNLNHTTHSQQHHLPHLHHICLHLHPHRFVPYLLLISSLLLSMRTKNCWPPVASMEMRKRRWITFWIPVVSVAVFLLVVV